MRWSVVAAIVVAGCGNDRFRDPTADAPPPPPPPGTPLVTVTAPAANAAFYVTETVAIEWTARDDSPSLTCEVDAADGAIEIATAIATTEGAPTSTTWTLANVTPGDYRVRVQCSDGTLVGTDASGPITVSSPPQQVSFANQIVPMFSSCTAAQCHDATAPQAGLNLLASAAYDGLVGVTAQQCPQPRVAPGSPNTSYLIAKLTGSGTCFVGTRMPKLGAGLSASQLQLVRDWIANGAPNN